MRLRARVLGDQPKDPLARRHLSHGGRTAKTASQQAPGMRGMGTSRHDLAPINRNLIVTQEVSELFFPVRNSLDDSQACQA